MCAFRLDPRQVAAGMARSAGLVFAGALVLAAVAAHEAKAQEASFGCKTLLCAAASAPSWSGIPYCVPVMQDLFRKLAHGDAWPSCPEGQTSGLGYDPYLACPAGFTAAQSATSAGGRGNTGGGGLQASPNGNLCADLSRPQQLCGGRGNCGVTYPTTVRSARTDPYFVDITTANGTQRFYFSLQGY